MQSGQKSRSSISPRIHVGLRTDFCPVQGEVFAPTIHAWVEKPHEISGVGIDGADVASLISVAKGAGVGEILRCRRPFVLYTDDVIYLAAKKGVVRVDEAVFAEAVCSGSDEPAQIGTHVAAHASCEGPAGRC